MNIDLFGKYFKYTFAGLLAVELISLLSFIYPELHWMAFFAIILTTAILSWNKIEYGVYIILTELFVGGKGHLFIAEINGVNLSIRIGLFLTVFLIWFLRFKKLFIRPKDLFRKIPNSYYILGFFIVIGLINGYFNNSLKNVFFDFNAWIFFGLIFILASTIKTKQTISHAIQILGGATTYLSLKTIGTLVLFSHYITGIGGVFYQWLRDTGVGEITYISGSLFRVFFQSQLYIMVGFLVGLVIVISIKNVKSKQSAYLLGYIYITSLAIIISQSRSYWVGLAGALVILIVIAWWKFNFRIKKTLVTAIILIVLFTSHTLMINILTGDFNGNVAGDRFKNLQSEPAGVSRLNQLKPLGDEILQRLILGYGFGKTVTYKSDDPRIVAQNPDGIYTTFAFEWGYLDIMLKLGLLGLLSYLHLIIYTIYSGFKKLQHTKLNDNVVNIGLFLGLVAVLATNMFSPYLNHPLGIGYLLLISTIYNQN